MAAKRDKAAGKNNCKGVPGALLLAVLFLLLSAGAGFSAGASTRPTGEFASAGAGRGFMGELLAAVFPAARAEAGAQAQPFSGNPEAVEEAAKSVLLIEVYDEKDRLIATGSGFVAFDNKTLVTNYHVIKDADWMIAWTDGGEPYLVTEYIAGDEERDIALVEFFSPTNLSPLALYKGETLLRAAPVVAMGYPLGLANTVSTGIISAFYDYGYRTIQFTASISHGSSGGALFNDAGEVIGVTRAMLTDSQNMNLATDISEVVKLWEAGQGNPRVSFKEQKRLAKLPMTPTPSPRPTPSPTPSPTPTPTPTPSPTPSPTPRKRFDLMAMATELGVILRWEDVPEAQFYFIYRESGESGARLIADADQGETYFLDSQAEMMGVACRYHVVAILSTVDAITRRSNPLDVAPFYTLDASLPVPSPEAKEGENIQWTDAEGAEFYLVYRSDTLDGLYRQMDVMGAQSGGEAGVNTYWDIGVKPGSTHFYKLCSYAGGRISPLSDPVEWTAPPLTYTAPPLPEEPEKGLEITGSSGYTGFTDGYPWLTPELANMSTYRTVTGCTLVFYCLDAEEHVVYHTDTGEAYYSQRFDLAALPGWNVYPSYAWLTGYEDVKYVYVAVSGITYMDGETVTLPEDAWHFYYWTLR